MSLYNYSANGTFRHDASAGAELSNAPPIIQKSKYRPALSSVAHLFLGGLPGIVGNFVQDMASAEKTWQLNMVKLQGTSLAVPGVGGKIAVLPKGATMVTAFEEAVPERRRIYTTATTKTVVNTNYLTFEVSSTDIYLFIKDVIVKNWSNSETKHAIVTDVNYSTNVVTVGALTGETAFTAVTDFFVSTTSLDEIEVIGSSVDRLNPSVYPSQVTHRPFTTLVGASNIKTYNAQLFQNFWEDRNWNDADYRAYPGDRPRAERTKEEAFHAHFNQIDSALLWGKKHDLTASSNRSGFNGLYNSITTNVSTVSGGALSLNDIDTVLVDQLGGTVSSPELYGLCSFKTMMIVESLFANLAKSYQCTMEKVWSGVYQMPINKISYRNRVIYLIPIQSMSMQEGTRTFLNPATASAYSTKLFLVDPAAVTTFLGNGSETGTLFFNVDKNIESPEESRFLHRHRIITELGFALLHEKTSAVINGIKSADLAG